MKEIHVKLNSGRIRKLLAVGSSQILVVLCFRSLNKLLT